MRVQEIAEELVKLTGQEVNELSMLMNKNDGELPVLKARPDIEYKENISTPKSYGTKLFNSRKKQKR